MPKIAILPMREDGLARKKWSVSECRFLTENGYADVQTYDENAVVSPLARPEVSVRVAEMLP